MHHMLLINVNLFVNYIVIKFFGSTLVFVLWYYFEITFQNSPSKAIHFLLVVKETFKFWYYFVV